MIRSSLAAVIDALAAGDIDIAVVWAPTAGYFAARSPVPLRLIPVSPWLDGPQSPIVFDISMGIRREDRALRRELDRALARNAAAIAAILDEFDVQRSRPKFNRSPVDDRAPIQLPACFSVVSAPLTWPFRNPNDGRFNLDLRR